MTYSDDPVFEDDVYTARHILRGMVDLLDGRVTATLCVETKDGPLHQTCGEVERDHIVQTMDLCQRMIAAWDRLDQRDEREVEAA